MAGTVIFPAKPLPGYPSSLRNVRNIVLASTFIHLCFIEITAAAEIISERR